MKFKAYLELIASNTLAKYLKAPEILNPIKNKKGEAIFPYFAAFTKEGVLYMKTNFIGEKVYFSSKELETIKKMESATPTSVDEMSMDQLAETPTTTTLDFKL